MRRTLTILAAALVLAGTAGSARAQADELLGRWTALRVTDTLGVPHPDSATLVALTFEPDGFVLVERTDEARAETEMPDRYPYRVDGSTLSMIVEEETEVGTFWFEADTLVIRDEARGLLASFERAR